MPCIEPNLIVDEQTCPVPDHDVLAGLQRHGAAFGVGQAGDLMQEAFPEGAQRRATGEDLHAVDQPLQPGVERLQVPIALLQGGLGPVALLHQRAALQAALDRRHQVLGVEWLAEIVVGALL